MKKVLAVLIVLFLVPLTASAQDFCEGNFDYDYDVDGSDAFTFKTDFGRSLQKNPCPPDGPSPVPKTWQWVSASPGDDGDLERGTMWPNPRFTDNDDETITDNLTGLMWLKDANCILSWYPGFDNDDTVGDGRVTWQHALDFVAGINDGTNSNCGGNPPYTDWRLPNVLELQSLIHYGFNNPAVPCTGGLCQWQEGDPFSDLQSSGYYWSSTKTAGGTGAAWMVYMTSGVVIGGLTNQTYYVWPVRGGH